MRIIHNVRTWWGQSSRVLKTVAIALGLLLAMVGMLACYIYVDIAWLSEAKIGFVNKTNESIESAEIISERGTAGEKVQWKSAPIAPGGSVEWSHRLKRPISTLQSVTFKSGKVLTWRERYMGNGREILLEVYEDELQLRVVKEGYL